VADDNQDPPTLAPKETSELASTAARWAPDVMERFKRGEKGEDVVSVLMKEGLGEHEIQAAFAMAIGLAKRERRRKDRLAGALWLVVGSTLVGLAHFTAGSHAVHYVLAWGAVLFGLYRVVRSFK